MNFSLCSLQLKDVEADALIVGITKNVYIGNSFENKEFANYLNILKDEKEITGVQEEITIIHSFGKIKAKRLVLVGLGNREQFTLDRLRKAIAVASRKIRKINCKNIAFALDPLPIKFSREDICCAMVEAFLMGLYTFSNFSEKRQDEVIEKITICTNRTRQHEAFKHAIKTARVFGEATNFARDIANAPSNKMTPDHLAHISQQLADQYGFKCTIFNEHDLKKMGMNLMMAVAKGSSMPPRFIILEYNGNGERTKTIGLLGKGVTFDSGGISLKAGKGMHKMKIDLTGGAVVLAIMKALATLKVKMNVVCAIPAVENMPSGNAYKPGDVYSSYSGKTVEILNTDAEGRLVLADALTYLQKDLKVDRIIDIATLTGGVIRALGSQIIGAFSNDDNLYQLFEEGCWHSGEYCWRLPLFHGYQELLKSDVADIRNLSYKPPSTIEGALFLENFINKDTQWMHLDIANVDYTDSTSGYLPRGATGIGLRSLMRMLMHLSKQDIYEHMPYQAFQYGKLWIEAPPAIHTL